VKGNTIGTATRFKASESPACTSNGLDAEATLWTTYKNPFLYLNSPEAGNETLQQLFSGNGSKGELAATPSGMNSPNPNSIVLLHLGKHGVIVPDNPRHR